MGGSRSGGGLSFQSKVLLPVVSIMVLLVAATMLVVNSRLTREFQSEAAQTVSAANAVFQNSQTIRAKNLLLRYRNVANEPRFKAACQKADPATLRDLLARLLEELEGETVAYTTDKGQRLASAARDPQLNLGELESSSSVSIKQALESGPNVDTILVGKKLFNVISIPINVQSQIVGTLTFGEEIGRAVAEEFKQLTHTEVVFRTSDHVAVSTLTRPDLEENLMAGFWHGAKRIDGSVGGGRDRIREVVLDNEHFLGLSGHFTSLTDDKRPGYLLLSSYEQPLTVLHATQRMLGLFSSLGILLSTAIVWILIRKITRPLRELRDSAEAVGRGDFSHRVAVLSRDECGKLACVFNEMTENLKGSREELEKTVETLRTTQAQLIQSEKLSAVGEFVAGVAHELNNPLTSVVGFAELMQQTEVTGRNRRFLEMIVTSAQRCHKIVQGLLSFARQHKPERKAVNLQELVEATAGILQYQLRTNNIQLTTQFDPRLPKVMADPHQLQQVFLNLLNNARHAIEAHRPRGAIRITTEARENRAWVIFQDDGPGISDENLTKIFNPFFTTKEVGKGTGLGLSLSYGIIREHGGSISVQSRPGEGATFRVELPIPAESVGTAFIPRLRSTNFDGKGKKVLVIDDEDLILNLIQETLLANGCQLEIARSGEGALRHLRAEQFDLTLCDWKMPGLNGQQVYEQVRAENPEAAKRFIFMTGDVMNDRLQKFLEQTGTICLSKPFSLDEFRSAVGQLLLEAA